MTSCTRVCIWEKTHEAGAASQIAEWCEARLIGDDLSISHVSTDTRDLSKGSLFVALRGENFDAHDFIANAEQAGAAGVLVSRPVETSLPQILCADTQEALAEFAAGMQQGRKAVVVALTGSNGKTSVKNLITEILNRTGQTYSTPGNRNNEIGLPMAVLDAPEDAQFAIYEMGAGKPGDIAYLCSIVAPQVSLVNNVGSAHLERMGSLLGIAETKGAIYEAYRTMELLLSMPMMHSPHTLHNVSGIAAFSVTVSKTMPIFVRPIFSCAASNRFSNCIRLPENTQSRLPCLADTM